MKYRVIIADDEVKIIQLITELGHWQELNMEVVAVCNDGEESLNSIAALHPDIVITDIKMPVIDGITMIEKAQQMGIHTNFIVISGYKYFEYARSAIQLGVVDYLLKPLDEGQLNRTLERACRKVEEERIRAEKQVRLEQYQKQEKIATIKKFWDVLLRDGADQSSYFETTEICNASFETDFYGDTYRCMCLTTNMDRLMSGTASLFAEKVTESCERCFDGVCSYQVKTDADGIFLVTNYNKAQQETVRRGISTLFYSIKDLSDIYGDFHLSIGVGSPVDSPSRLGSSLQQAKAAEWGRLVLWGDRIIDYDMIKSRDRFTLRDILTEEEDLQLNNAVRAFQFGQIGEIFRNMEMRAHAHESDYPGNMQETMTYLLGKLAVSRKESTEEDQGQLRMVIRNALSFPQMIKEFYLCFNSLLHKQYEEIKKRAGKPIEDAKAYIHEHFGEAISLEMMAEQSNLSPAYFSRLFKAETNVGFLDYLTSVRMEEAKRMLVESNGTIKEIAARVGYMDDKHFSKTFKKQVGISPKEYRKLYS